VTSPQPRMPQRMVVRAGAVISAVMGTRQRRLRGGGKLSGGNP
jgi:hypothetical protein